MNRITRLLVTGTGGIGGVNFIRALRWAASQVGFNLEIVGTDHNSFHLQFPDLDFRYVTPKHSDPVFIPTIIRLIEKHGADFLHLHPSSEARVVSEKSGLLKGVDVKYYLPRTSSIMPSKLEIFGALSSKTVPVPRTVQASSIDDIGNAFSELGTPLWIRAKQGAGGRLGLRVSSPEEAEYWVKLNVAQGRASVGDFLLHDYLPGRDLAFDSLWYNGKLVTSYARERLEYPFKHLTLSGLTGTPTIARTIEDKKVNAIGKAAVEALDEKPHGFFSVDLKDDANGNPVVTEVDGKWHTTAPLWGYAMAKIFDEPEYNLAYLYLSLGLGWESNFEVPAYDLFPENYYLVRQLDSGVVLKHREETWRI